MRRPGGRADAARRSALELVRLAVARSGHDDAAAPAIPPRLLDDPVQVHVAELAALHRVGGSALAGLTGIDGVDPDVVRALAEQRTAWASHHLASLRVLREISDGLDGAGVRWLVYKGPVLAAEVYGHPGDRAYGDLDLLLHPADLGRGVAVLEDLGFEHGNHHWRHAAWVGRAEFPMGRGSTELDVHWHLQYAAHERADLRLDLDALFERVRRMDAGGVGIAAPSPEDSLLLTGYHACRSGAHRLLWMKDIERLLTAGNVDVDRFVELAAAANLRGQLAVAVDRAARLLVVDGARELVERLGRSGMVGVDRLVTRVSPPIRVDERDTLARAWARSVRGGASDSVRYVGRRGRHRLAELAGGAPPSQLDDAGEKQEFFDAVAASA